MADAVLEMLFARGTTCGCCDSNEMMAEAAIEAMARTPEVLWPPLEPMPPAFVVGHYRSSEQIRASVAYARGQLPPPTAASLQSSADTITRHLIPMLEGQPLYAAFCAVQAMATQIKRQIEAAGAASAISPGMVVRPLVSEPS